MRDKLTIRIEPETLNALRNIAKSEHRPLQALINEALSDLVAKRRQNHQPRPHVMRAYQTSHEIFGSLYKKLAQ